MNAILCQLDQLAVIFFRLYSIVLLIYAVLSWIPDWRGAQRFFAPFVEPVLAPIRRIIPPLGGLDLAFLVLLLALNYLVVPLLGRISYSVCNPF